MNGYRWTWADVTATADYAAIDGYTYHSPKANTPTSMQPKCTYYVPFTVFNGSKGTFYGSGTTRTRLSYHWYNSAWQLVTQDGERTELGSDLPPGQQRLLNAKIKAPLSPGYYYLTWDLVQETVTWYFDQGATRQVIGVNVSGTSCP